MSPASLAPCAYALGALRQLLQSISVGPRAPRFLLFSNPKLDMPFDDFTRRALAAEADGHCAAPHCRHPTGRPGDIPPCTGDGAHIHGSKPGAPRYDAELPEPIRESEDNGIWLCPYCHRVIDRFVDQYDATVLFDWKAQAAEWARTRRTRSQPLSGLPDADMEFQRAQAFLDDQRPAVTALRELRRTIPILLRKGVSLPAETKSLLNRLLVTGDRPFRNPRYQNWCHSPQLKSRQEELLRLLMGIASLHAFRLSVQDAMINFRHHERRDSQGRPMECYDDPAAAAIVAYLEYFDDVSDYVARERMPRVTAPSKRRPW